MRRLISPADYDFCQITLGLLNYIMFLISVLSPFLCCISFFKFTFIPLLNLFLLSHAARELLDSAVLHNGVNNHNNNDLNDDYDGYYQPLIHWIMIIMVSALKTALKTCNSWSSR